MFYVKGFSLSPLHPWWKGGVFIACLWMSLIFSGLAGASGLPERGLLQARLDELMAAQGDALGGVEKRKIEALEASIEDLEKIALVERQRADLEAMLEDIPVELEQLSRRLQAEEESPSTDALLAALGDMSLEQLEQYQTEQTEPLHDAREQLAKTETQLLGTRTLPERAQQAITEATRMLETARSSVNRQISSRLEESAPQRIRLSVRQELAEAQLALNHRMLATNSRLRELLKQRQELLERWVEKQEAKLLVIQSQLEQRRRENSEALIAGVGREVLDEVMSVPVIAHVFQRNRELTLELLEVSAQTRDMQRLAQEAQHQLDKMRQVQRGLADYVEAARGSILLSQILREQRKALPKVAAQGGLKDDIADLRLKQLELDHQREALSTSVGKAVEQLTMTAQDPVQREQQLEAFDELIAKQRKLIDELEPVYGEQLSAAIELKLVEQQQQALSVSLQRTIDKQLFWVANARPLDLAWLRRLPEHFAAEWRAGEWRRGLPVHWKRPGPGAWLGVPVALVAVVLLGFRRRILRYLQTLHDQVGRLRFDSQAHTPKAVALTYLLALPKPLLLLSVSVALQAGAGVDGQAVGTMLLHVSLAWSLVAWMRALLVPGGVAIQHFHWSSGYASQLRYWLLWLGVALMTVLVIGLLAQGAGINLSQRPLVMLLLLSGLGGMSWSLAKLVLAHVPYFGIKLFRLMLGLLIALVPLVLGGLVVYGYTYMALSVLDHFVLTLYLCGFWVLVESMVVRGLAVAARRLAYRRALAQSAQATNMAQERADNADIPEEPPLDMQQVSQQSLRLFKLILMMAFVVMLYLVWRELLTVLSYLDQIAVFGGEMFDAAGSGGVSVADVLVALLIFALAVVMARNLPGLLEVMVLSRLELKPGSAFAISSLLAYTIMSIGIVASLGTLGVSWQKLQWLVAALGVGLGFGLQEIFANFISGLIILFERPVRIGDTITIGTLSGTVSRIRIRAITVVDFDLKEVIIPNKTFVTDQLINWSLSDSVTRVILHYGVAHGSDQPLVHQLLHQAARENPRVLKEPEPQVYFMAYTSSSMDFEVRIFVSSLKDRLMSTDETNVRVAELFAEHGVKVAHNRLDVRLDREQWGPEPNR
ncbi:mechanosensitive channel MscK [Halomonas halocynthiae]|uniref:mechanosensitive channel MscK n=1 Tax=Halomonas halocynthiae TaxID=176290 RepID=UPI00040CDDF5|nr:mechanosensitive channel MscK [Halomonas halocynthiae]